VKEKKKSLLRVLLPFATVLKKNKI